MRMNTLAHLSAVLIDLLYLASLSGLTSGLCVFVVKPDTDVINQIMGICEDNIIESRGKLVCKETLT